MLSDVRSSAMSHESFGQFMLGTCRYIFEKELVEMSATKAINLVIKFALPGAERQDSVRNGFQETAEDAAFVAIHDSARPLITVDDFR